MSTQDKVLGIVDTVTGIGSLGTSIVGEILHRHFGVVERVDDFLAGRIIENGIITEDDYEKAAQLYLIPQMRKKSKNIAKIMSKANAQCEVYTKQTNKSVSDIDDDWLDYFLDRASLISDDAVQSLWASIFTHECFEHHTFRKVMLDRMALLDRESATSFGKLCALTYLLTVSDGREYSIPLYLRDDALQKMVSSRATNFNEQRAKAYQQLRPSEEELETLQEIGLIKLSEINDDCDVYSSSKITLTAAVGDKSFMPKVRYDRKQRVHYVLTGNLTFTGVGLELYHRVKNIYPVSSELFSTLHCFMNC